MILMETRLNILLRCLNSGDKEMSERKRIVFDVHPELHTQVKVLAARRNISMNLWLMRAIADRIKKETREESNVE